jgi:hypothetical protein
MQTLFMSRTRRQHVSLRSRTPFAGGVTGVRASLGAQYLLAAHWFVGARSTAADSSIVIRRTSFCTRWFLTIDY